MIDIKKHQIRLQNNIKMTKSFLWKVIILNTHQTS